MVNRREFLRITAATGATLALTPELLGAAQKSGGKLIQRAIPSSREMLPVIGLGRGWSKSVDHAAVKETLKTLFDNGGRVLDTVHGNDASEQVAGASANELGIQDKIFWSISVFVAGSPPPPPPPAPGTAGPPPKADPAAVKAQVESSLARLKVPKLDLAVVPAHADIPTHLAVLREMKKEGRVRYIGVTDLLPPPNMKDPVGDKLESLMRNEPIDFVGFDYSVGDRRAEQMLLPLAQERKIGVLAYFPFDRSRIFQRASSTPLPEWAAEFDAKTWAQFFLKYVVSHPAVTVVRTGTTQAAHMLDNIGGGIGRLPDEATRKRMAALVDALPAAPQGPQGGKAPGIALPAAVLDRYVGEYVAASGFTMVFRREGEALLVKPGANPEAPLAAKSETRFSDPRGPTMEFQLDGEGKVTGLILEQGGQPIALERK
jgi:aryl-alcohol dehydrogenase-like predicted oxidoreductase